MALEQIIKVMRMWYMPNYFDLDMFDYTSLSDEEVANIYFEEKENYGEELDTILKEHIEG